MHSHTLQASRLELAARFQIPQRDLRLLDPWVPVPIPVSFLVRKHAILANFGAVRVLISRCEVRALESERNGMYVPAMAYQMLDWGISSAPAAPLHPGAFSCFGPCQSWRATPNAYHPDVLVQVVVPACCSAPSSAAAVWTTSTC